MEQPIFRCHDTQHNDVHHNYTRQKGLYVTLSINESEDNNALYCAECHHTECRIWFIIMLCVLILNAILLSVAMLNVILMSVVASIYIIEIYRGQLWKGKQNIFKQTNLIFKTLHCLNLSAVFKNYIFSLRQMLMWIGLHHPLDGVTNRK